MKKMLALLLTMAMLLPSLTTVFAASVGQIPVSPVLTNEKTGTELSEAKTSMGEKRNVEFTSTKDAVELYGFSMYYDNANEGEAFGFVRFMSSAPETVEFLNGYYNNSFVSGDYVPEVQSIFALKKIDNTYTLLRIDAATFSETEIKPYGEFFFVDMAFDTSSDVMYGVKGMVLYTIDLATGDYTEIGMTGTSKGMTTLACSDEGVIYAIDSEGALYTLNKTTGAATLVGNTGVSIKYLQSMTWDHVNGGLYWANCNQNDGILYSVDTTTAAATAIGNINGRNMEVTCLFTKGISTGDPIAVNGIDVVPESATLKVGRTLQLAAQIQPWNAAERGFYWGSSNPTIATVDAGGIVTAVANGEVTITATTVDGGFTDTCVITVPDTAEIDAAFDSAINAPGGNYHFANDEVYPWEVVTVGERTVVKSTNVRVDGSQALFTMNPIDMYRGNKISFDWFASCEVGWDGIVFIVNGERVASFTAESTEFENYIYLIPAEGEYTFAWAYVKDASGFMGEDCGYIDNVALDATPPGPVTSVTLTPAIVDLYQTQTLQLMANIVPASAIDIGVSFSSSAPNVATVDESGLVTAIEAGTAIITVTTHDGGFTATSTVNVTSTEDLMTEINAALNAPGGTLSFTIDMVNMWIPDGTTFAGRKVAHSTIMGMESISTSITLVATTDGVKLIVFDWMISSEANYDKAIFAIDGVEQASISGTDMRDFETLAFSAGAAGEHTYTWTYTKDGSGNNGEDMLWLDNIILTEVPAPQSVAMNTTAKVHLGQTMNINAAVVPYYAADTTLTYTTSDAAKVTVDENGFITGVAEGSATITATAVNGVNADCIVTVFNTIPSPDGKLYGFIGAPEGLTDGLSGFVRIDPTMATVERVIPYPNQIFAAEYYNGVIYAFDNMTTEFLTFDAVTKEILSRVAVSEIAYDMTYDYTTNTMYALFGNNERGLATVDMATGELTYIGIMPATSVIITLAADNTGKLYGVASTSGILYQIDKETAECIEVGDTTVGEVGYVQSMTYSYEADTLYWAGYTKTPIKGGFLYSINRSTGVATTVFDAQIGEICGLMAFNNDEETPPAPTAVTGVSLDSTSIVIPWGGSGHLTAAVAPENATNKRVEWSSTDDMVVTVDANGNLSAVGAGIANVTVTTLDG
ncbi:MAG: Ig-like domain-containing protein, partial [Clostridia bacterium]